VTPREKWDALPRRTRRLLVAAGVFEGVLKIAALVDLARRPPEQIRGSKAAWAGAVALINALGAVPVAYFAWGRQKPARRWPG
jgi:phospholipase D-like protein